MISSIRLQNFRSYADESFEFDPGVNIIVGPNASGKTNLLEALLLICQGNSYRAPAAQLIRFNHTWARLDSNSPEQQRTLKLRTAAEPGPPKTLTINGRELRRITMSHTLPAVLFEPAHLSILAGAPERRRQFIDDLLEQTEAGFKTLRHQYTRTLQQRNSLLKSSRPAAEQLFAWNVRLSELGGRIARARLGLIEKLNGRLSGLYSDIVRHKSKAELAYSSSCPSTDYSSHFLNKLEQDTALDLARGFTPVGPHRDDIAPYLDGHPAVTSASRGEMRTLLLALKILELELVGEVRGQKPLLLLDDVFSELDGKRRRALTGFLQSYQTFITTTDADVVIQHFMNDCRIIPIQPNQTS